MNNHSLLNRLMLSAAMLCAALSAAALDLPVRTVNGTACYYHEVLPKETVNILARRFGLTKAQIIKYNPSVADGLRAGQMLYFPKAEVDALGAAPKATPAAAAAAAAPVAAAPAAAEATSHLVKRGETVYGISRQYGIAEEELLAANPQIEASGLKSGMVITIPEKGAAAAQPAGEPLAEEPLAEAPLADANPLGDRTVVVAAAAEDDSIPAGDFMPGDFMPADFMPGDPAAEADTLRIAVMLPFMLASQTPDKQAQLYTEFYRGLLVAADSLRSYGQPLIIAAYDTADDIAVVDSLLALPAMGQASVIIAPDDERQLTRIASFANLHDVKVFNLFAVKSVLHRSNPAVMQANIPHTDMYDTAVEGLLREYPGYTPVLLIPQEGGKSDKAEFQSRLRAKAEAEGRSVVEVVYQGMLQKETLDSLAAGERYMFVPASGKQTEFTRIIGALKEYKQGLDDYNGARLFGFPEWIVFRGEALDNMRFMNTTIYSRFYNDDSSLRSKDVAAAYTRWYGTTMLNALPVQGVLGFDVGMYLIRALNADAADFPAEARYRGVQTDFRFTVADGDAGAANRALYLVNFRPSGITEKIPL